MAVTRAQYRVVPFKGDIRAGEDFSGATEQLQQLINAHAEQGWDYVRLETLAAIVTTSAVPGRNGCVGFGAVPGTPERRDQVSVYAVVFRSGK